MKHRFFQILPPCAVALLCSGALRAGELRSNRLVLSHDPQTGAVELAETGGKKMSLTFSVPRGAKETVADGAMKLGLSDGAVLRIALPNGSPFALLQATLSNGTGKQTNTPHFRLPEMSLDLGVAPEKTKALGTAGLTAPDGHPGSYVFLALADPETRAGVVAAWTTFDKADGVLFSGVKDGKLTLAAQNDYGRLLVDPGKSVEGETLALGFFGDVRLGLEQWADLTARTNKIRLLPQESGYCTWYSRPNGGASDEKHVRELSAFAAKELKPWGFEYVQIDDKWQDGKRRHGPAKVFSRAAPDGPYPSGMKAVANAIRGDGLVAGIWYMPFSGDQEDPWFADKQDWFAKRPDGSAYWTSWGGGSLDLTNPKVQKYVKDLARLMGRDWGYKLFKLDGLWTGLANAQLYVNNGYKPDDLGQAKVCDPTKTPFEAYRNAFRLLREGAGKDVYILGCNVSQNMRTLGAVIGYVDTMRIGPDNGPSWKALQRGPWHGANRWFFHNRIWFNDPDPIYVRPSVPLNHARAITSWVTVTGMHNACSEWLPELPKERLDLIRRSLPPHKFPARPADVLDRDLARIWVAEDKENHRYVVGLFNWDDSKPWRVEYPLAKLGLPAGKTWVGREYWSQAETAPFTGKLVADVAPGSCQVIALRELRMHPFVLSSSRNIVQGLTDVSGEKWDAASKTLSAATELVAGDPTTLTIFALGKPDGKPGAWAPGKPKFQAEGVTAEIKTFGPVMTLALTSPVSRKVAWTLPFSDPKPAKAAATPKNLRAEDVEFGRARIVWDGGGADHWKLERDGGPSLILQHPWFLDEALAAGKTHVYRISVCGGGKAELKLTAPDAPEPGPVPPKPEVYLNNLKAKKLSAGPMGRGKRNRSIEGNPLTIEGKTYQHGLGVHADSVARYPLKPAYKRFVAVAGLDDEQKNQKAGSVVFVVRITREDTTTEEVARSPVLTWNRLGHWHFDVIIPEGARAIELLVNDAGDGNRCDHADWAEAGFVTK